MSVRFRYDKGAGDVVKWFRGRVLKVEEGMEDAMEDSMREGAEYMRYIILTSGTEKSGKPGRVETRDMLDDVHHSVNVSEKGRVTGRFGWTRNREDYYALQEGGFQHSPGVSVEGMNAVAQASEYALEEFEKRMKAVRDNA